MCSKIDGHLNIHIGYKTLQLNTKLVVYIYKMVAYFY